MQTLSEFDRLKLSYKKYRLKHCMGHFNEARRDIHDAFERFRGEESMDKWSRAVDAARRAEAQHEADITTALRYTIIDELRKTRREEELAEAE